MEKLSMNWDEFAVALGFEDREALLQASDVVGEVGDVSYFVTRLPNGEWAAWDDVELALDRVETFPSREEATRYLKGGIEEEEE